MNTLPASPVEIGALIPHQGRMCLLDAVLSCSPERIVCRASNHQAPDHPLRSPHGLLAPVGIEYREIETFETVDVTAIILIPIPHGDGGNRLRSLQI